METKTICLTGDLLKGCVLPDDDWVSDFFNFFWSTENDRNESCRRPIFQTFAPHNRKQYLKFEN